AAGVVNQGMVKALPAGSMLVVGQTVNWSEMMSTEQSKQLFGVLTDAYAKEVGKDPAAVRRSLEEYWKWATETYAPEVAAALLHEPGTVGGAVLAAKLEPGRSGRDAWKSWSESFAAADILGPKGSKYVTWSFQVD